MLPFRRTYSLDFRRFLIQFLFMFHDLKRLCLLACAGLMYLSSMAQDTLKLTLEEAKAVLLKDNLSLLASYYDVNIAEAQAMQARAWNNPYLHWNQDMYSVELDEYFNYRNQFLFQIDQTFSIAGKYTNTVRLAKANAELNKLMLKDVMRCLLMDLGEHYNLLFALQQKQAIYEQVLDRYTTVIEAGQKQLETGAIASNEVVRLRSEQIALQTEALGNANEISEVMSQVRILLNLNPGVYVQTFEYQPGMEEPVLGDLFTASMENRPDFQLAKQNITYQEMNLKLQKSMAFPDVNVGYQPKDRGSNYVRPYEGLVVEFAVPLFNRNAGNIKAAEGEIQKARVQMNEQENVLLNEVSASFMQLINTRNCLENYNEPFLQSMEKLNDNANINYNKKNISLLEYIDLQRIYIQNKMQYLDMKYQYLISVNRLNFSVGKDVIY